MSMVNGVPVSSHHPIKCEYSFGYGGTTIIYVKRIISKLWGKESYLELVTTEGVGHPATWLTWEQGEMTAGCYENF